jgi:hypothetical protein
MGIGWFLLRRARCRRRCEMRREWQVWILVALLSLLVGCSGGETPTEDATTQASASPGPAATVAPTDKPEPASLQAIVVDVVNDVDADPLAEGEWQDAVADMAIYKDGQVWAQEASTARVSVAEDLVRVAPNTIFAFEQLDSDTIQLNLDEGQVWVRVEGLSEGEAFEVETPAAVASVRGTRFSVRAESDGTTIVSTKAGTVTVSVEAHSVTLAAGYQTTIVPGGEPTEPGPMSPEERMRWGMASGADLDVSLPVLGARSTFTYTGHAQHDWVCSSDGRYFSLSTYSTETEEKAYLFYDAQASEVFTVALPAEDVYGVTLNPTGDGIGYMAYDGLCTADIYGANPVCFDLDIYYMDFYWSPDGEWILVYPWVPEMASAPDRMLNLYKVRSDGSDLTQLTFSEEGENRHPVWSLDSSMIAYLFFTDYQLPAELWTVGADGTDSQMLYDNAKAHSYPAWNPDGSLVAMPGYSDEGSDGGGLWMVPTDGSDPWALPGTDEWSCYDPVWSPTSDGWPLLFYGYHSGMGDSCGKYSVSGLWAYTPGDGLMHVDHANWGPVWCPNGRLQAAFGFTAAHEDDHDPVNAVQFFEVEPGLWP